jgi:hypothetical protein
VGDELKMRERDRERMNLFIEKEKALEKGFFVVVWLSRRICEHFVC